MRKRLVRVLLVVFIVALPFLTHAVYLRMTAWPQSITLASGPVGGRHRMVMEALAEEIQDQLQIEVKLVASKGSLQNLRMLESGEIDFGLYQSGSRLMTDTPQRLSQTTQIRFVSNIYSEVAHWLVRRDSEQSPDAARKTQRIAIGQQDSGDAAMSSILIEHLGWQAGEFEPVSLSYDDVRSEFLEGTLDEAFITVGVQAEIFRKLASDERVEFRNLPNIEALTQNHIPLSPYTIPQGLYRTHGHIAPTKDIETVAVKSQLLCRYELKDSLVESVTAIALGEDFMKRLQLGELFTQGLKYANAKPEFPIHSGAAHYFDPQLKPIVNSDFVEAMEGMRSFLVSLLLAIYLGWRWWVRRNMRLVEHRLDRYIHRLLEIERKPVLLGEGAGTLAVDCRKLQALLDEVANLRQDCLKDFTAHELNEDRSIDCFLEMCHALSEKINARLTRVTLDRRFHELAELLSQQKTGTEGIPPAGD